MDKDFQHKIHRYAIRSVSGRTSRGKCATGISDHFYSQALDYIMLHKVFGDVGGCGGGEESTIREVEMDDAADLICVWAFGEIDDEVI